MIAVGETIISEDILEKKFVCDLNACKGACCVLGDAGAPLEDNEADILEEIYDYVKPFMAADGIKAIEADHVFTFDTDGDLVTPLVDNKHCAYVVFEENGLASCAIEKAWKAGKVDFQKPISCHLYPIRITKYKDYEAVNYHEWEICKPACECGAKLKVPTYKFLEKPLTRKYGSEWYSELKEIAEAYLKHKGR